MPKIVDYPRATLSNSLELAEAVSSLGGSCTAEMAAERMNRKTSGAFSALVSSAIKYGWLASKSGKLGVQQAFRDYKLAYNEDEKLSALRTALLSPPLFRAIYERFKGRPLPVEHFEKLLIREFEVPNDQASRISMYFMDGASQAGMLGSGNVLIEANVAAGNAEAEDLEVNSLAPINRAESSDGSAAPLTSEDRLGANDFSITFRGPGLNSTVLIVEEEDLLIVEAMLRKVKKALLSNN
jgi:hypothetical protein